MSQHQKMPAGPRPPPDALDRMGGVDGMRAILTSFYAALSDDILVGFFFAPRDRATLIERQLEFTARFFGAEIEYRGRPLLEVHRALPPILPGHFDRRHMILERTLEQHRVPADVRESWLAFDRSFRRAVLHRE